MADIEISLSSHSYIVRIESGLLSRIGDWLAPHALRGRLQIVTDGNVAELYRHKFAQALNAQYIETNFYVLPVGENAKSWTELEKLTDWLIDQEVGRQDTIVALGGGVVGDITGFASAIVKRGCNFIQIPTSLLAQVDSSVGGKTAINSRVGKNMIGAFHQPNAVYIDPDILRTLSARHMRAGYAEIVKYGLINDAEFFAWCCINGQDVLTNETHATAHAIATSVRAKADIVAQDEREITNVRALLNLGHTFAHALEAETGYSDRLYHGEAVALGMVLAHNFSARIGLCSPDQAAQIEQHLNGVGLPTTLSGLGIECNGEKLFAHMMHDKKRVGTTLPFILSKGIGRAFFASDIESDAVIDFLNSVT